MESQAEQAPVEFGLLIPFEESRSTMEIQQRVLTLLEEIRDQQQREARRAKVRWTRLTIFLAVALLLGLPAICSYIRQLLVNWF